MTVDGLIGVYIEATNAVVWEAEKRGLCPMTLDMQRAGVTAIIRALRDEFREEYGMWERFTKILGSDAAPAPQANTVELSQAYVSQIEQSRTEAHRNAAPAVCVWTKHAEKRWSIQCSPHGFFNPTPKRLAAERCAMCKAPIKFTEANHG